MEKIKTSMQFEGMICVDCSGQFRSGGLALMWKSHHKISLQSFSLNHIDATVTDPIINSVWRFTGIYGFPEDNNKYKSLDVLKLLQT